MHVIENLQQQIDRGFGFFARMTLFQHILRNQLGSIVGEDVSKNLRIQIRLGVDLDCGLIRIPQLGQCFGE